MAPPHPSSPSSQIGAFVDPARIRAMLAPFLPDEEDRAFVARCLVGEGPAHHRGANFVLLSLLSKAVERAGGAEGVLFEKTTPVPMRLPPHLVRPGEEQHYPLDLPLEPLLTLAPEGSRELAAMVDCLTDGPPQHALANVAMVRLLGVLLSRLGDAAR